MEAMVMMPIEAVMVVVMMVMMKLSQLHVLRHRT